jgi:hypothetical protein
MVDNHNYKLNDAYKNANIDENYDLLPQEYKDKVNLIKRMRSGAASDTSSIQSKKSSRR